MDKSRGGRGLEVVLPGNGLSKERACLGAATEEEAGGNYAIEHPSFLWGMKSTAKQIFPKDFVTHNQFLSLKGLF